MTCVRCSRIMLKGTSVRQDAGVPLDQDLRDLFSFNYGMPGFSVGDSPDPSYGNQEHGLFSVASASFSLSAFNSGFRYGPTPSYLNQRNQG